MLKYIKVDAAFIILSSIDSFFLIIIILYYIYLGAEINENFKNHREIMMHNK